MTSGHEAVKADLVAHLSANIGDWVDVVAVDSWPPAPALVAATDILPVDEDKPWPCVLVSTTSMSTTTRAAGVGSGVFIGDYGVRVTVAVRTPKSKDFDQAAVGRDRLLAAVRYLLLSSPKAGDDCAVLTADFSEQTDPVAVDAKGRPVAVGTLTLTVRHTETIPDLAEYGTADAAIVELGVTDADGSLFTNQHYDAESVYDDPADGYDGGTEWPAKP
ncbi:MAG: hypothetical protein RLZZ621_1229 [Gemmatimonadota bacterium]